MVKKKREKYGVVCGVLFFFIQKNKEVEWLPGWCWYGIGMVLLQAECSVVQRNITEVKSYFFVNRYGFVHIYVKKTYYYGCQIPKAAVFNWIENNNNNYYHYITDLKKYYTYL